MGKRDRKRQNRAAIVIRDAILATIQNLQTGSVPWFREVGTYYRVKKLKSGAVDAMLRLTDLPDGIPVSELLFDLQRMGVFVTPPRHKVWVSMGFIGSFAEPPEPRKRKKKGGPPKGMKQLAGNVKRYDRYAGQEKVIVYSRREINLELELIEARDMADILEGKQKRPEQIFYRIYWEAKGGRPPRKRFKYE